MVIRDTVFGCILLLCGQVGLPGQSASSLSVDPALRYMFNGSDERWLITSDPLIVSALELYVSSCELTARLIADSVINPNGSGKPINGRSSSLESLIRDAGLVAGKSDIALLRPYSNRPRFEHNPIETHQPQARLHLLGQLINGVFGELAESGWLLGGSRRHADLFPALLPRVNDVFQVTSKNQGVTLCGVEVYRSPKKLERVLRAMIGECIESGQAKPSIRGALWGSILTYIEESQSLKRQHGGLLGSDKEWRVNRIASVLSMLVYVRYIEQKTLISASTAGDNKRNEQWVLVVVSREVLAQLRLVATQSRRVHKHMCTLLKGKNRFDAAKQFEDELLEFERHLQAYERLHVLSKGSALLNLFETDEGKLLAKTIESSAPCRVRKRVSASLAAPDTPWVKEALGSWLRVKFESLPMSRVELRVKSGPWQGNYVGAMFSAVPCKEGVLTCW